MLGLPTHRSGYRHTRAAVPDPTHARAELPTNGTVCAERSAREPHGRRDPAQTKRSGQRGFHTQALEKQASIIVVAVVVLSILIRIAIKWMLFSGRPFEQQTDPHLHTSTFDSTLLSEIRPMRLPRPPFHATDCFRIMRPTTEQAERLVLCGGLATPSPLYHQSLQVGVRPLQLS